MTDKILLGRIKSNLGTHADGENVLLEKHKFDCGWYWAFGYVGNRNLHCHMDGILQSGPLMASELFEKPRFSDSNWWVIRDLFIQAYALKKAAEVYRYGGHQTTLQGVTDIIKNDELVKRLNADLEKVLDTLWNFMQKHQIN